MARARLAVALGAGAARGLAHIGVLQVFEETGIEADYVAGTSIGALVGALYAAGVDLRELEKVASNLRLKHLADFVLPGRGGLIGGDKLRGLLNLFLRGKTFDDLRIPLAVVATDLKTGQEVVFREGKLVEAILASCAIPGVFVPVTYRDRLLADGGLVDRVPVRVARSMGPAVVVAVDVGANLSKSRLRTLPEITMQAIDIMQEEIMRLKAREADVFIRPDVGHFNPFRLDRGQELVRRGREAALVALPQILASLKRRKPVKMTRN
ncbi:MAG: patatin family protein [Firmicutes bacterium]|nr:patatin family protein [Bacillota bacterium]